MSLGSAAMQTISNTDTLAPSVPGNHNTVITLATIVGVAAVLHFGQEVFLPLSVALLLAFALSPLVSIIRRRGVPHTLAVLAVVCVATVLISVFVYMVATQLGQLIAELPKYQTNIIAKLDGLQDTGSGNQVLARLGRMAQAVMAALSQGAPAATAIGQAAPIQVEVVETASPLSMIAQYAVPVLAPLATAGIVVIVIIFLLLEREDLRDRFIRLVGAKDLNRTTRVIEDAARRVSQYLIVQVGVNVIYALPIGFGLWMLGLPNAVLFGLLTLVLRFIPYIGSAISGILPMIVAFAISPDWSLLLWTAALFGVVEMVTSNFIEPYLYGGRTGVSPLAIIVSAVFWTWIWGPMGLILATPLTVCLVVLGRHVPQFEVFHIMFGDDPVLSPEARLYQRFLAGDIHEATLRAEEAIQQVFLAEYYRDVALPSLMLAQSDFERGVLTPDQEQRIAQTALAMAHGLAPVVHEERALAEAKVRADTTEDNTEDTTAEGNTMLNNGRLDGLGSRVLVIGGRSALDDVAAAMIGQAMEAEGAQVTVMSNSVLHSGEIIRLQQTEADSIVLAFLDASQVRAIKLQLRRIRRAAPGKSVGILICTPVAGDPALGAGTDQPVRAALDAATTAGADFAAATLENCLAAVFTPRTDSALTAQTT